MLRFFLFLCTLTCANLCFAATHCVSTATQFRTALSSSSNNGEFDEIRLRSGVYFGTSSLPFSIDISEPHGIKISGGWNTLLLNPCAYTSGNATLTVLDGSSSATALRVRVFVAQTNVPITVEGLTFRNGKMLNGASNDAAGLAITSMADGAPFIAVDRIIAENNTSSGYATAVSLSSDLGFIRFTNSIVRTNQTVNTAAVNIHTNQGGSSLHHLTVVNNNLSSVVGAVHWIGASQGHLKHSLVWNNTGAGDLYANPNVLYFGNRYGVLSGLLFPFPSDGNIVEPAPLLDSLSRPAVGSPLRDKTWGFIGTKDVYGNARRINGSADIGAAEGLIL